MMGIGERWKGLAQKARNFWAELTEDEARKAGPQDQAGAEVVHQRYGGTEKNSELLRGSPEAEQAKRVRDEESMDQGPEDALLGNPAARAGRSSQRGGTQQMQDTQQSRQYTQQGGSGLQKTVGQQMGGQAGSSGGKARTRDE